MVYGSLAQGAAAYRETCASHGRAGRRVMCSYFIHVADIKAEEDFGRAAPIRYFNYGLKPDAMVRDQMSRFMAEVAPAFR